MARPSKLSEQQRTDIKRRLLDGERPSDLAREYKVSKATITGVNKRAEEIKIVADQVVSAERALGRLPVSEQLLTVNLAARLRSISDSLSAAADLGAKTAHRLSALANNEVAKIDDADPLQSLETMKGVALLTKLANSSADIAINLLAANKDTVKRISEDGVEEPDEITPERISEGTRRIAFLLHKAAAQPQGAG
jgi:hypothetical protein